MSGDHSTRKMVVAIDFGTTYTGFAYAYMQDKHIALNPTWGNAEGVDTSKAPTSVLLDTKHNKDQFEMFGYDAEKTYREKQDEGNCEHHELFRLFKMRLFQDKDFSRDSKLHSERGYPTKAVNIFAIVLEYMKNQAMQLVEKQHGRIKEVGEVLWVITVPAIWSEKSKQFMREAALHAGIIKSLVSKQLILALEPEVAALYCTKLPTLLTPEQTTLKEPALKTSTGTKYIVVDAGGGTVDIKASEVVEEGKLKEITVCSGGDWGGNKINEAFEEQLETILGKGHLDAVKEDNSADYLKLMRTFEIVKRSADPRRPDSLKLMVDIPMAIGEAYKDVAEISVDEALKKSDGKYTYIKGKIRIDPEETKRLFMTVVEPIVEHVKELLKEDKLAGVSHLLLVGGFGDSEFLRHEFKKAFNQLVVVPRSAGMAVMKGAVAYGLDPTLYKERKATRTYGISVTVPFNPKEHSRDKAEEEEDGKLYCEVLHTIVGKDESVRMDEVREAYALPMYDHQNEAIIEIYASDQAEVKYITDDGVDMVAELRLNTHPSKLSGRNRLIHLAFEVGQTEMKVTAKEEGNDGDRQYVNIDFLCA